VKRKRSNHAFYENGVTGFTRPCPALSCASSVRPEHAETHPLLAGSDSPRAKPWDEASIMLSGKAQNKVSSAVPLTAG